VIYVTILSFIFIVLNLLWNNCGSLWALRQALLREARSTAAGRFRGCFGCARRAGVLPEAGRARRTHPRPPLGRSGGRWPDRPKKPTKTASSSAETAAEQPVTEARSSPTAAEDTAQPSEVTASRQETSTPLVAEEPRAATQASEAVPQPQQEEATVPRQAAIAPQQEPVAPQQEAAAPQQNPGLIDGRADIGRRSLEPASVKISSTDLLTRVTRIFQESVFTEITSPAWAGRRAEFSRAYVQHAGSRLRMQRPQCKPGVAENEGRCLGTVLYNEKTNQRV